MERSRVIEEIEEMTLPPVYMTDVVCMAVMKNNPKCKTPNTFRSTEVSFALVGFGPSNTKPITHQILPISTVEKLYQELGNFLTHVKEIESDPTGFLEKKKKEAGDVELSEKKGDAIYFG